MKQLKMDRILPLKEALKNHSVYEAIHNMEALRLFMGFHVFSVWDFMSLLKFLQQHLAPTNQPWVPTGHPTLRRFINDIVLEEESDIGLSEKGKEPTYASHFELYCQAMHNVGADTKPVTTFVKHVRKDGIDKALSECAIPSAAQRFLSSTFGFIATGKPHVVASAFALGREHVIPIMFRSLLDKMNIGQERAPAFHYYLERHIHLDSDHHGPMAMLMLNTLCDNKDKKLKEAEEAAVLALQERIQFWDGVEKALRQI
ncbi:DUF3050 domain-containing protein [Magnetococcales bacterium HHB-1]